MTDAWTDRLSDYLDGELDQKSHDEAAQHLECCAQCRATLRDLRRIRDWASTLQPDAGDAREWTALELRIRRRANFTLGLRVAAMVLGAIGLAALAWYATGGPGGEVVGGTAIDAGASVVPSSGDVDYAAEVHALETLLRERGHDLDPRTRKALQAGLESIHETLAMVRQELARNPQNGLLRELELRSRQQKLSLLNRTVLLSRTTQRPRVQEDRG